MKRGWVLVETTRGKGMVEFDARGRIYKADPLLRFSLGRKFLTLKRYLAAKNQLKNWEEYVYGR